VVAVAARYLHYLHYFHYSPIRAQILVQKTVEIFIDTVYNISTLNKYLHLIVQKIVGHLSGGVIATNSGDMTLQYLH
jgi:hypothetical protein